MSIKINSYGGIVTWYLRKHFSEYISKIVLEFVSWKNKDLISDYIQKFTITDNIPLFKMVNIETINRCNGSCAFCPANVKDEKRKFKKMSPLLYAKIIDELKNLNWEGQLFLNVNNEPFLDKEIINYAIYAKKQLGDRALISIITNGTLLSIDKLEALTGYVDVLVINNYGVKYRLSDRTKKIYKYVKKNAQKFKNIDIKINRRYSQEILATRAGNAPNKKKKKNNVVLPCIYPYTDITIFPDGKVGLCCNDCFEITEYGDLSKESMLDIWNGPKMSEVRTLMSSGRMNVSFCRECDVSDSGFREKLVKALEKKEKYEKKCTATKTGQF